MPDQFRVFGPPGCGKTTFLAKQVAKWGSDYGPESLLVASFSRTAAAELQSRGMALTSKRVGTLHAHALRALGRVPLVERRYLPDWNGWSAARNFQLSSFNSIQEVGDGYDEAQIREELTGDMCLGKMGILRARLVPVEQWPVLVQRFHKLWEEWKRGSDLYDFADLIELVVTEQVRPPTGTTSLLCDEAQDFTAAEMRMVDWWAQHVDRVLLAGDDDQAIFGFRGGNPQVLVEGIGEANVKILSQSFRVPKAVHRVAEQWVKGNTGRVPKQYLPRDFEGRASFRLDGSAAQPEWIVQEIVRQLDEPASDGGRKMPDVMVLATCGYMLKRLCAGLVEARIPWHNPYRPDHGAWNPFRRTTKRTTASSVDRLLAFLRPRRTVWGDMAREWTWDDVRLWVGHLDQSELFAPGGAALLAEQTGGFTADREVLSEIFFAMWKQSEWERMLACDINWFASHLKPSQRARYALPIRTALADPLLLIKEPKVVVGTIHSVKGGEARHVHVLGDLSLQGDMQFCAGATRPEIVRQFYVGMTRSFETLTVWCGAGRGAGLERLGAFNV